MLGATPTSLVGAAVVVVVDLGALFVASIALPGPLREGWHGRAPRPCAIASTRSSSRPRSC
jgi:hypothetical protein